jgi:hypothetical protein
MRTTAPQPTMNSFLKVSQVLLFVIVQASGLLFLAIIRVYANSNINQGCKTRAKAVEQIKEVRLAS